MSTTFSETDVGVRKIVLRQIPDDEAAYQLWCEDTRHTLIEHKLWFGVVSDEDEYTGLLGGRIAKLLAKRRKQEALKGDVSSSSTSSSSFSSSGAQGSMPTLSHQPMTI